MNICRFIFLFPILFLAPIVVFAEPKTNHGLTESTASPSDKDIEILKLKLEIEKLKNELNNVRVPINEAEPPFVRPPKMSEQEFIESHRTYQNKQGQETKDGFSYPRSLILRYKKMMDDHPSERSYCYLYARLLPTSEAVELTNRMIQKWPKFAYGYRMRKSQLMKKNPPDCKAALVAAEKEVSLDPESDTKEDLVFLKQCVDAASNAFKVKLTYDIEKDGTTVSGRGKNVFTVSQRHSYETKTTTISLKYVGLTKNGYLYEVIQKGDFGTLCLLLIPKDGKRINDISRFFASKEFKTGNGVSNIYLSVEDMLNLKEIQLTKIYF